MDNVSDKSSYKDKSTSKLYDTTKYSAANQVIRKLNDNSIMSSSKNGKQGNTSLSYGNNSTEDSNPSLLPRESTKRSDVHRDSSSRDLSLGSEHVVKAWGLESFPADEDGEVNLEKEEEVVFLENMERGMTKIRKDDNSEGLVPTCFLSFTRPEFSDKTAHHSILGTQTQVDSFRKRTKEDDKYEGNDTTILKLKVEELKRKHEGEIETLKNGMNQLEQKYEGEIRTLKNGMNQLEEEMNELKKVSVEPKKPKQYHISTQPKNPRVKHVSLNMKPPPSQVASIHSQIVEQMKERFSTKGIQLSMDGQNPTIVTVCCGSRIESDIARDVTAANLTEDETNNLILLRIIPTNAKDVNKKVDNVNRGSNLLDLTFLTTMRAPKLHPCNHNSEQYEKLMNYILTYSSSGQSAIM